MSKTVMVSGGYDPIHIGHIRQFKAASWHGNLVIALCSDAWLLRKKGYVFMPYEERKEILEKIKHVWKVVPQIGEGDTAVESLIYYKPKIFAKGGDRTPDNMPQEELEVCKNLGIELVYGIGGDKAQSSSELIEKVIKHSHRREERVR